MRRGAADDCYHERRALKPRALGLGLLRLSVRVFGMERGDDRSTCGAARLTLEHDEAPRYELTVVRHP